jgi:uncharacterized protein YdiU (UPF0061 family)
VTLSIAFDNSYARLPARFYQRRQPVAVAAPVLIRLNTTLALWLGLDPDQLASPAGIQMLVGNAVPEGAEPIALAYAGHQFGNFVPQLGDGRAVLLGEVVTRDGERRDIQLKGSGPTAFSRRGDGRAALGPVLREYVVSEAMAALGVPTTRALAAVLTGDWVYRETALPGAVITRVAASHIRVGTFEYFAAQGDTQAVRLLADHAIARHYPHIGDRPGCYGALLEAVVARQAALMAQWLSIGFIHGVMNTDNTAISGETIDYGPCAFMDSYDPVKVFSSIDQNGRYAYGNQPLIARWNLARFAETLLPLLADDEPAAIERAHAALAGFAPHFDAAYAGRLRLKLGLTTEQPGDTELLQDLLKAMADSGADFTLTFRRLADAADNHTGDAAVAALFPDPAVLQAWLPRWRSRLATEEGAPHDRGVAMRAVNPLFIPRNHQIQAAISAAEEGGDFSPFNTLVHVLAKPFDEQPGFERYAAPPRDHERVLRTFCGT